MKSYVFSAVVSVAVLSGCVTPPPVPRNFNGQPVTFSYPVLKREDVQKGNLTYVLVEKSIADGSLRVLNISKSRQPIQNERQERIVFNGNLTKYAPDFDASIFYTYTDAGDYNFKTVVMDCRGHATRKTQDYSPCNSDFGRVFVPFSVYKAGAAGAVVNTSRWEDPSINPVRVVVSPENSLRKAGVFDHLDELISAK